MEHLSLSASQAAMTASFDQMFRTWVFFEDDLVESGFANLGLFLPDTPNQTAACENMMERLLGLIRQHHGQVLDVGCGVGGPTQYLTRFYPPAQVHGVNISANQLETCRLRVPDAHFHLMPAERLEFSDASFDTVVSVEAAPHFKGRREFLKEAHRVLKPGGELAVADILFHAQPKSFRKILPEQEFYRNIDEYRALWEACGFRNVTCEDVTRSCVQGFVDYTRGRALHDLRTGRIDGGLLQYLLRFADKMAELPVTAYVLAHASKPA